MQVFPPNVIADMDGMLVGVVEQGTGRRAILGPDIKVGGKTGTTNGYKDAWFCGFTGNYAGCVWYGNDDDTPMNNMTGGTLPAQTWHDIMEVAHRGIELTPIPGLPASPPPAPVASQGGRIVELGAPDRPTALSRRSATALGSIDALHQDRRSPRRTAVGRVLRRKRRNAVRQRLYPHAVTATPPRRHDSPNMPGHCEGKGLSRRGRSCEAHIRLS